MRRWLLRGVLALVLLLAVSIVGGGFYLRRQLHASLPIASGTVTLPGLDQAATVERDALGVPTITAASRADAARALGFLHAQDRFFQMDLQRRQAAGELSALVGRRALELDKTWRVHRFRTIAREAVARAAPGYRAVLDAYAAGVNGGLSLLAAAPIEYTVLGASPERWQVEDTLLTVLTMFTTLQGRQAQFEATVGTVTDTLPPALAAFLIDIGSEWDAPVTGGRFVRPITPGPDVLDVRAMNRVPDSGTFHARTGEAACRAAQPWALCVTDEEAAGLGSNNWAVAGTQTASGVALVANDMHLAIGVPNIWYRASMRVPDRREPGRTLTLTGVTLPGLPSLVVGSNGHVAWGFTNTGGDWSDLVVVEPDPRAAGHYLTPSGSRAVDVVSEPIATSDGGVEPFDVRWTMWGPIVRRDHRGRDLSQKWVAHDATLLASDITAPEEARSVDEALAAAAGLGIPAQNFVVGDAAGRIGWTIAGPIPNRVGFDGTRPTSWADGTRRWDGYLDAAAFPRVVDPPSGRLWTANAPVVEGAALAAIGEGGYADGIRARIIRDRLMHTRAATAADMLAIQLDASALFLDRWRDLVLQVLTPAVLEERAGRAEFRRLVEERWTGTADPASVGYRLVRTFRAVLARELFTPLTRPAKAAEPDFDYTRIGRTEGPLWQLVTERPAHLLDRAYRSWDERLVAAVDTALQELTADGRSLAAQSWGEFNRAMVAHPLGAGLPLAGRWLNMPADPLPGDIYTPRAHSPRAGPSERMVVSPGREHEGILHMPTGQSGHPLSPHYRDQHRAWVTGEPLPFLPGPPVSTLALVP